MREWEETPSVPQGLDRAGSAGLILKIRRDNIWCTKYNFDGEDGVEVYSYKAKDLGVPDC